jgi:hypothetical protein
MISITAKINLLNCLAAAGMPITGKPRERT